MKPRLCTLKIRPDFNGYGFEIHEHLNRAGHIVGVVDPGSPAEAAGIKPDDYIIEVNNQNVVLSSHESVIEKIKQGDGNVQLLVVDKEADHYYKSHAIPISSRTSTIEVVDGMDPGITSVEGKYCGTSEAAAG